MDTTIDRSHLPALLVLASITSAAGCVSDDSSAVAVDDETTPAASAAPVAPVVQPERPPVTATLPLGDAPTFAGRPATLAELLPPSWRRQLPVELSPEAFAAKGLDWSAPVGLVDYGCAYFASIRDLDRLEASFTLSPDPPPSPQQTIEMVDGMQVVNIDRMPSPDCDWSAVSDGQPYHALWMSDDARAKGWRSYQAGDGRTISIIGTTVLFSIAEPWASGKPGRELTLTGDLALTGETPVSLTWAAPHLFGADQTTPAALAAFMARTWNFRVPDGYHGSASPDDTADAPYREAKSNYAAERHRLLTATQAELAARLGAIQATQRDPNDRLYTQVDAPAQLMASLATVYEQGTRSVSLEALGRRISVEGAALATRRADRDAAILSVMGDQQVYLLGTLSDGDGASLEDIFSNTSAIDLEEAFGSAEGLQVEDRNAAGAGDSAGAIDPQPGGGAIDYGGGD